MRSNTNSSLNSPAVPVAWQKAELAALRANAADTCDDRVSEDIFDIEDERAAVDSFAQTSLHSSN